MLLRLGLSFALCLAMVLARADTPQTLFSDGFELLKTGKTKEAAAKFEVGLKADPTNALAHYYLGEAYLALKRDADAKKEFQKSLDLDSASSIADKAKERLTELSPSRVPPSSQATASNGKNGPSAQETLAFISEMESCPAILQKTETYTAGQPGEVWSPIFEFHSYVTRMSIGDKSLLGKSYALISSKAFVSSTSHVHDGEG